MVQEITTKSWGSRIVGALWGVLIGFACIIGAFFLVFWNEGHALHRAQSLQQAHNILVSVPASPVDAKNNMAVIYTSGLATTNDVLEDKSLNVSEKAIQLNRNVTMYQWDEEKSTKTEKNVGGSEQEITTYTYKQVWSPELIDSSGFKESGHQNPSSMPFKSKIQYAKNVTVGDFILPEDLITQISGDTSVDLAKADLEALKAKVNKPVQHQGEGLFMGEDANAPKIGDMRVTMKMVLPETVSIIAQQTGSTLQPYMAPAGQTVSLIDMGQVSADQMIHEAEVQNQIMCWLLRLASLILMMIGFGLLMQPVVVLADVIPFFGNMVGFGTGLIAFILGLGCWTVAIAIAWFAVRPMWAVGLIGVAAVICYLAYRARKAKNPV